MWSTRVRSQEAFYATGVVWDILCTSPFSFSFFFSFLALNILESVVTNTTSSCCCSQRRRRSRRKTQTFFSPLSLQGVSSWHSKDRFWVECFHAVNHTRTRGWWKFMKLLSGLTVQTWSIKLVLSVILFDILLLHKNKSLLCLIYPKDFWNNLVSTHQNPL